MALDTLNPSLDLHMLAEIRLTGTTLYFSGRHIAMDDGNWYDGRLKIRGRTLSRFHSLSESKQKASSFVIRLDNRDQGLNDYLTDYEFGNREVIIRVGTGTTLSDYVVVFIGFVKKPGGIRRGEDVTLTLVDAILRDEIGIPTTIYNTTDYPNIDSRYSGQHVPIVYGEFIESVAGVSTQPLKAYCVDISTKLFEVAGHTVGHIGQVYLDGAAVAHSLVSLGPQARFTVTNFTPGASVVSAEILGKTGLGVDLAGETHLTHPVDILYDYMTSVVGITTTRIDKQSFIDTKDGLSTFIGRRVIDEHKSSTFYQVELLNEYRYELTVSGGCYVLDRLSSAGSTNLILRREDVVSTPVGEGDPDSLFTNYIMGFYNYQPVNKKWDRSIVISSVLSQVAVGATVEREMKFYWQYTSQAQTRMNDELYSFDEDQELVVGDFKHRASQVKLGDIVELDVAYWNNIYMQVREVDRNWDDLTTTLTLWDVPPVPAIPTVDITFPVDSATYTESAHTVTGTAFDEVGLQVVEVRQNGGSWNTATGLGFWSWDITLTDGANTIEARSQNIEGTYSPIVDVDVTFNDSIYPEVEITYPLDGVTIATTSPTITGTATDNEGVTDLEINVNGAGFTDMTIESPWSYAATFNEGEGNTVAARAYDAKGNLTTTATNTITVRTGLYVWLDDPYENGRFEDASYSSTIVEGTTEQFHEGQNAIKWTPTSNFGGYSCWTGAVSGDDVDYTAYSGVEVYLYPTNTNKDFDIIVSKRFSAFSTYNTGTLTAGQWNKVTVPFSTIGADGDVYRIEIIHGGTGSTDTCYIDNIRFYP